MKHLTIWGNGFSASGMALPLVIAAAWFAAPAAHAQLSTEDIEQLRKQGEREGWTFTVGENGATSRSLKELTGLIVPPDWRERGEWDPCEPKRDLPVAYDWRDYGGCPPIRNQSSCGSCWAFGAVGATECSILIKTGETVDLSEQWLVSCTDAGSCAGGWHTDAFQYMMRTEWPDYCGDHGAVPESDFPYQAWDVPCGCPYTHPYWINKWAYVGGTWGTPSVDQIKQAILDHGPVATCVYVNSAFHGYSGGVFNGCQNKAINHVVVLVGWDDTQGDEGVWIMRNSWGPNWGEDGYMRIKYNCSKIGFVTCYVACCTEPVIDSVTASPDPITRGQLLTLSAEGVTDPTGDDDVSYVAFYDDSNDNCEVDTDDIYLGKDKDAEDGWRIQIETDDLAPGDFNILARAKDLEGMWSLSVCTGVQVLDYSGLLGVEAVYFASDQAVDNALDTVDLFARFDDPTAKVMSVDADIDLGIPLYQHDLGSDTAPAAGDLVFDPLLISDSFVTLGVVADDGTDGTFVLGDFDSEAFNTAGIVSGSWTCDAASQAVAGNNPYRAVRLARLTLPASAESVHGAGTIDWTRQDSAGGLTTIEFTAQTETDCNFNGIPDAAEMIDCNSNGLLDECEIAYGYAVDINGNEIPDVCECLADLSGDGTVDVTDLLALLGAWGLTGVPEDLTGDGVVDVNDLLALLGVWGPCA